MVNSLETIILMFLGLDFFDAINHSLTTTSTGGFSTKQASIAAFQNPDRSSNSHFYVFSRNEFYLNLFCFKLKFKKLLIMMNLNGI